MYWSDEFCTGKLDPVARDCDGLRSKNCGCYFQCLGGLASLCLRQGQAQGNVRPHWVSLGGLVDEENHVPHKLMHFYIVQLFNRPAFWMGDVMEALERKGNPA